MERKPKIIIVDDSVDLVSNLRDILEEAGYNVADANDGQTALTLCRERVFDLGLIDIELPDISGEKLIEKLVELSPGDYCIVQAERDGRLWHDLTDEFGVTWSMFRTWRALILQASKPL